MSQVKLKFLEFGFRPPPFVELLFDAELENSSSQPIWFLFPLHMDAPSEFGRFLASSAEIFELPGQGQVRIARFIGDGNFQLIRLAPRAHVRIHEFPITFYGEISGTKIQVPVMLAGHLSIGDQDAEKWFPLDMTSSSHAEVTEQPGAIVASQETPGVRPVPVIPSETQTLTLEIHLRKS